MMKDQHSMCAHVAFQKEMQKVRVGYLQCSTLLFFSVFISLMIWGWGRSNLMQPWKQLFFSSSCYQGSPHSVTRMLGSTIGYEVTGDHDNAIKKQHVVLNIDRSWIPGSATISIFFFASLKQSRFQTHCLASLQKNMFPAPDDMNNYKLTKKSLHIVSNKLGHVDTALCILHSICLVSLVFLNPKGYRWPCSCASDAFQRVQKEKSFRASCFFPKPVQNINLIYWFPQATSFHEMVDWQAWIPGLSVKMTTRHCQDSLPS